MFARPQRIAYTRGKRVCIRTVLPSWWGGSCFRCPFDLGSSTGNEVTLVFCEGHPTAPCILHYHQSWYSCDFRVIYSGLVHVLFVLCSPSSTTVVNPNPRSLQWNGRTFSPHGFNLPFNLIHLSFHLCICFKFNRDTTVFFSFNVRSFELNFTAKSSCNEQLSYSKSAFV